MNFLLGGNDKRNTFAFKLEIMMTNSPYSFFIPDGYRIRRAIYKDTWQLMIQLFQFSNNGNNN